MNEKSHVHLLRQLNVELPRAQKPQQCDRVQPLRKTRLLQHAAQLMDLRILLGCRVAWVARLLFGSGGGEVVVVVLLIEFHFGGHFDGIVVERWFRVIDVVRCGAVHWIALLLEEQGVVLEQEE